MEPAKRTSEVSNLQEGMTAKENGKVVKMMNGIKFVRVGGGWTPFEEFEKRRRRYSGGTLHLENIVATAYSRSSLPRIDAANAQSQFSGVPPEVEGEKYLRSSSLKSTAHTSNYSSGYISKSTMGGDLPPLPPPHPPGTGAKFSNIVRSSTSNVR